MRLRSSPLWLLLLAQQSSSEPTGGSIADIKAWLRDKLELRLGVAPIPIRWLKSGLDGRWFFNLDDGEHGSELWESDLTEENTKMLRDIRRGPEGSYPHHLCEFKGRMYFAANDGERGIELWVTDGTEAGTELFLDLRPGPDSSYAQGLLSCGDHVFFGAADDRHGFELWATDGTQRGTVMVHDIVPGHGSAAISNTSCVDGVLYFSTGGLDGYGRVERWQSDGTTRRTWRTDPPEASAHEEL